MTRVHVIGAAGYAAAEAIRYLDAHPYFELGVLESRSLAGERLGDHFPLLRTTPYRCAQEGSVVRTLRAGDAVIVAGNEEESRAVMPSLLRADVRVVDLSAAYRASAQAVYGLSEWRSADIAPARLVANPGCYPTASLLALLPLASFDSASLRDASLRMTSVVIDAKSGISGAGRTPQTGSLFAEVSGEIRAYALNGHRHLPEIERGLRHDGVETEVVFTPQVVPIARGMLACAYATFDKPIDPGAVHFAYRAAYRDSAFVRVLGGDLAPSVAAVAGTNDVELRVDVAGRTVRAVCALDNLGKGAAGQAVQNLNIMFGLPESSGLHDRAILA
jgi:N-acetyl-gamma-glutamyl-phosphate reductase